LRLSFYFNNRNSTVIIIFVPRCLSQNGAECVQTAIVGRRLLCCQKATENNHTASPPPPAAAAAAAAAAYVCCMERSQ
jgi:hypothetical protein